MSVSFHACTKKTVIHVNLHICVHVQISSPRRIENLERDKERMRVREREREMR